MNAKIAVMQPYLFPYIGYFQLLNAADKFVILDDVNFIKKGWINRNKILVNNEPAYFTIPLVKSSQNKLIKDIAISYENNWQEKFLKTIERSYSKAPFFEVAYNLISKIILRDENKISDLIYFSLMDIKEYLCLKTDIVKSSGVYNNSEFKGEERIIDICLKENSEYYVNPIGGIELYSKNSFSEKGICLNFIKTNKIEYQQFGNEFFDSLSIIDVLMFNHKEKVLEFLNEYEIC
jgi:hypothetical protein